MARTLILASALAALAGCATETHVVNNSFDSQFGALNKNGWQVASNDQAAQAKRKDEPDPNVRVIRGADWSAYHFETNFQVDDPKLRAQNSQNQQGQPPAQTSPAPAPNVGGMTPFGPAPALPGR